MYSVCRHPIKPYKICCHFFVLSKSSIQNRTLWEISYDLSKATMTITIYYIRWERVWCCWPVCCLSQFWMQNAFFSCAFFPHSIEWRVTKRTGIRVENKHHQNWFSSHSHFGEGKNKNQQQKCQHNTIHIIRNRISWNL